MIGSVGSNTGCCFCLSKLIQGQKKPKEDAKGAVIGIGALRKREVDLTKHEHLEVRTMKKADDNGVFQKYIRFKTSEVVVDEAIAMLDRLGLKIPKDNMHCTVLPPSSDRCDDALSGKSLEGSVVWQKIRIAYPYQDNSHVNINLVGDDESLGFEKLAQSVANATGSDSNSRGLHSELGKVERVQIDKFFSDPDQYGGYVTNHPETGKPQFFMIELPVNYRQTIEVKSQ